MSELEVITDIGGQDPSYRCEDCKREGKIEPLNTQRTIEEIERAAGP